MRSWKERGPSMSTLTRTADRPGERADAFLARVVPDLTRSAAQRLLEARKERPHLRSGAQRLAPGILRAAQAMVILRGKTGRTA